MTDMELKALEQELEVILSKSIRAAEIVLLVRNQKFGEDCQTWLAWAKERKLSRRYAFRLLKVGKFLKTLENFDLVHRGALIAITQDVGKIEVLADMHPSQLGLFMKRYNIAALERDELRDAVAEFLGQARRETHSGTFTQMTWNYDKWPDACELRNACQNSKILQKLDFDKEKDFLEAFQARVVAVAKEKNMGSGPLLVLLNKFSDAVIGLTKRANEK